jgi:hypothetical protein
MSRALVVLLAINMPPAMNAAQGGECYNNALLMIHNPWTPQ